MCDDKADIIGKRNVLCGQINNVYMFFCKRDPVIKLSLLTAYRKCFYGRAEIDMGPYLLTQPNPTANGHKPNPTHDFLNWRDPTQPNPTHIPDRTPQGYC